MDKAVKRYYHIILLVFLPLFAISCSGTAIVSVENIHETINIPDDQTYEPTLTVTVNGETKTVASYSYEDWEVSWIRLVPWEEVTVRASVSYPPLSNPGQFEQSFRVKDGDMEDVVIQRCPGYQP